MRNSENLELRQNEEHTLSSEHHKGTHVRCTVKSGKGSITIREYGDGSEEHFDGPFELSAEVGGRISIKLDLDKAPNTPNWDAIVKGTGEGENVFLLELLEISQAQ